MINKKAVIISGIVAFVIVALIVGINIKKLNEKISENEQIILAAAQNGTEETMKETTEQEIEKNNEETENTENTENAEEAENSENNASENEKNKEESKVDTENSTSQKKDEYKGQEETSKEEEKTIVNAQEKALNLVKQEWGEDDTVYFTVDNKQGNIYNISVRNKSTTEALVEYRVNVEDETVIII